MKKILLSTILFTSFVFADALQENPFLVPERVNPRINAVSNIAKELKRTNFNSIAVVYMNTSDLCALTSASLVASLKTLGVEAYYLKGGDQDLPLRIKNLKAKWIYLAYFGELPHQEVQNALNNDLKTLSKAMEGANLIIHPTTLSLGFLSGAIVDEDIARFLEKSNIRGFIFENGKPVMVKVSVKDLEIRVEREEQPAQIQQKRRRK
ncbi:hypothetical protein [Thermocrinis sp.]